MQKSEDILENCLNQLRGGKTQREILAMHPDNKNELEKLLSVASPLLRLPYKDVPEPARQRKYLLIERPKVFFAWLHISKFASVSAGILLLVSMLSATTYAAIASLPGSKLFVVKKATESARMAFATSDESKAMLQVEIAQKRLNEARQVLSGQNNPKRESAAIAELISQTESAIESANKLAVKQPGSVKNKVDSLALITQQQQDLLKDIRPEGQATEETKQALEKTAENLGEVAAIRRYIETAGKEVGLAELGLEMLTGTVSSLNNIAFLLGKTEVFIDNNTIVKNNEKILKLSDLANGARVEVKAKNGKDGKLTALQINLLNSSEDSGEVKGDATSTTPSTASTTATSTPDKKTPVNTTSTPPVEIIVPENDPNTAVGSYIIEDPAPQFHQ